MQMAMAKFQLEELKKPNPRYVLDLHTILGMIQEADNMDKGLKSVLYRMQAYTMPPGGVPLAARPPSMGILPPSARPANPDSAPQRDESAPSPEGGTSQREGLFDEEVRIAMGNMEIR
jgi:hypothetical protein